MERKEVPVLVWRQLTVDMIVLDGPTAHTFDIRPIYRPGLTKSVRTLSIKGDGNSAAGALIFNT